MLAGAGNVIGPHMIEPSVSIARIVFPEIPTYSPSGSSSKFATEIIASWAVES